MTAALSRLSPAAGVGGGLPGEGDLADVRAVANAPQPSGPVSGALAERPAPHCRACGLAPTPHYVVPAHAGRRHAPESQRERTLTYQPASTTHSLGCDRTVIQ
jgi:hypothetical protein